MRRRMLRVDWGTWVSVICVIALALLAGSVANAQTFKVIYTFRGHNSSSNPIAGVTLDKQGNLYGTTAWGGAFGGGAVYELRQTNGSYVYNDLHDLGNGQDGSLPGVESR